MSVGQAVWVGALPGAGGPFSPAPRRSMATITGGVLAGMSRRGGLEFSFFLSMPHDGGRPRSTTC
jgi:undecaprenyl pyrophosphate phosphatase UppP